MDNGQGGTVQHIILDQFKQLKDNKPMYLFLDQKEITTILDLKRKVVMTMLNSLEKLPEHKRFFKFEGILPSSVGLRFHKSKSEDLSEKSDFIRTYMSIAKEHQGVFRCSIAKLAFELNISPFQVPKILYSMQSEENGEITYEVDQESFVLRLLHVPSGGQTLDLSQDMLAETQRIEKNMIQKLNCMYFVARRISMPTIEHMLKKEKTEDYVAVFKIIQICTDGYSKQLNELINLYFSVEDESTLEAQIAGDEEERQMMMPLQYITEFREKASIESEIRGLLKEFHEQSSGTSHVIGLDASERVKPLDVVKILMGIYSDRANIKRYMNNGRYWAKYQEYDYEGLYKLAHSTVNRYYLDQIDGRPSVSASELASSKKRRLNE